MCAKAGGAPWCIHVNQCSILSSSVSGHAQTPNVELLLVVAHDTVRKSHSHASRIGTLPMFQKFSLPWLETE
jgi:hypothetical protein